MEKDATALSSFELLSVFEGLGSVVPSRSAKSGEQGDWRFTELLADYFSTDKSLNLRDCPDLAPSFFVASLLFRKRLEIRDTPQLHDKECDRARALVKLAKALGLEATEFEDGFSIDARNFKAPSKNIILATEGDHRMAMAIGVLSYVFPNLKADNEACVAKSFPNFWNTLLRFKELLP